MLLYRQAVSARFVVCGMYRLCTPVQFDEAVGASKPTRLMANRPTGENALNPNTLVLPTLFPYTVICNRWGSKGDMGCQHFQNVQNAAVVFWLSLLPLSGQGSVFWTVTMQRLQGILL